MGKYQFDQIINRENTGSIKYDSGMEFVGRDDLLPMWVADMDFRVPDEVLSAIHERTEHGIFGYTSPDDDYYDAMETWFAKRYGWNIDRSWNTIVPGVVYAISCAIRAVTEPGDAVLIQEPVYYPFRKMIEQNRRICISSPLKEADGKYHMDFQDLEHSISEHHPKAMILCSPHNPVGRVWTKEELKKTDALCRANDIRLIADEIHCDFIYPGHTFTPFGTLGKESLQNAIICTAPSKTFNLAGLQLSNILIADPEIRKAFRREHSANGCGEGNVLGMTATKAAYRYGEPWLEELLKYLWDNINYMRSYLAEYMPQLRFIEPEGTYLVWIDFSQVVRSKEDLKHLIQDKAKLWLDNGAMFGEDSALYERFNIACPRSILTEALERLRVALDA